MDPREGRRTLLFLCHCLLLFLFLFICPFSEAFQIPRISLYKSIKTTRGLLSLRTTTTTTPAIPTSSPLIASSAYTATAVIINVVVEEGSNSYFQEKPEKWSVSWRDALQHISVKLGWDGDDVALSILDPKELSTAPTGSGILLLIGLSDMSFDAVSASGVLEACKAVCAFDCSSPYETLEKFGKYDKRSALEGPLRLLDTYLTRKSVRAKQRFAFNIVQDVWGRQSSDDLVFLINILVDTFVRPIKSVQSVTSSDETSLSQLQSMVQPENLSINMCI